MTDFDPPPELHYAQRAPLHHRQWVNRAIILLSVVLSLLLFSKWAKPAWRRARLLYWEHECIVYQPDANRPVLQVVGKNFISIVAPPWKNFYDILSPPGFESDGTIFCHRLISPHGHQRLVAVDAVHFIGLGWYARVFKPGELLADPSEARGDFIGKEYVFEEGPQNFSVFPAKLDSQDASHFSFVVANGEKKLTVNGWLSDDDTVRFDQVAILFATRAATQPAPPPPASSP